MKLNQISKLTVATICLFTGTFAFANAEFQAGDIQTGEKHPISMSGGVASYYKDGTSGRVKFTCDLEGEYVKAMLTPGKNFSGNSPAILSAGINGPYTWNLYNLGNTTGNIKVKLITGRNATIQCKAIA